MITLDLIAITGDYFSVDSRVWSPATSVFGLNRLLGHVCFSELDESLDPSRFGFLMVWEHHFNVRLGDL